MATSQLALYNEALVEYIGERELASLSENREPRRVLDSIWANGAVKYCLEQGHWNFAQRVTSLTYTPAITSSFGYNRAFEKPTDIVKLSKFCSDEFLNDPLLSYTEEAGYWFTNQDTVYLSYVSDDALYGLDFALWPESFKRYVASYLALRAVGRLTQSATSKADLIKISNKLLTDARSKDAMQGATQFLPPGNWANARAGGGRGHERGNRGQLIG